MQSGHGIRINRETSLCAGKRDCASARRVFGEGMRIFTRETKKRLSRAVVAWILVLGWVGPTVSRADIVERPMASTTQAILSAATSGDTELGNQVLSIENGYDALLLRVHLIRQAQRSIDLQTFIWTNDECGRLMICELVEAARRGVRVRIIADHMVSDKNRRWGRFSPR